MLPCYFESSVLAIISTQALQCARRSDFTPRPGQLWPADQQSIGTIIWHASPWIGNHSVTPLLKSKSVPKLACIPHYVLRHIQGHCMLAVKQ